MDLELFQDRFDTLFPKFLDEGLSNGSRVGSEFRRGCYGLLCRVIEDGQIGPDLMPGDESYCRVLTVAGYLAERGSKVTFTWYIATERARDLMRDC